MTKIPPLLFAVLNEAAAKSTPMNSWLRPIPNPHLRGQGYYLMDERGLAAAIRLNSPAACRIYSAIPSGRIVRNAHRVVCETMALKEEITHSWSGLSDHPVVMACLAWQWRAGNPNGSSHSGLIDLSYLKLMDAQLPSINLSHFTMFEANFSRAYLWAADFAGADLSHAVMKATELAGASLMGANLWYALMQSVNLASADLSHANLHYANLSNADLGGANFTGANLTNADLFGARLWRTNFRGATLTNANLGNLNLAEGIFDDATVSQAQAAAIRGCFARGQRPHLNIAKDIPPTQPEPPTIT